MSRLKRRGPYRYVPREIDLDAAQIPWELLRLLKFSIRTALFSRPRTPVDYFHVEMTHEELKREAARAGFAPGWSFSFEFHDEVVNMRRTTWIDDEYEWYQTHIRTYDAGDGWIDVEAHHELDALMYPKAHNELVNFDVDRGMADLRERVLLPSGATFDRVEVERLP